MLSSLMHLSLTGCLLAPLFCAAVLSANRLFTKLPNEILVSRIAAFCLLTHLVCAVFASALWVLGGMGATKWDFATPYVNGSYAINISLFFDAAGAVFLTTTAIMSNIIIFYSRRYLHRDPGYRRFF